MKSNFISILIIMIFHVTAAQKGEYEQYLYAMNTEALQIVPILHYQNIKNWYGEVRYNYEDTATVSIYGGKVFFKEKNKLSYSLLPLAGIVLGRFQGGSLGLNIDVEYRKMFFYTQSQYTFSARDRADNFFYSWSELGYEIWDWLYAGVAIQHTHVYNTKFELGEKGFVIGISVRKWVFPLYIFNPSNSGQYFILGINKKLTNDKSMSLN